MKQIKKQPVQKSLRDMLITAIYGEIGDTHIISAEKIADSTIDQIPGLTVNNAVNTDDDGDVKQFAKEIYDKLSDKYLMYPETYKVVEAVRQMVEHKMKKEGWHR